MSPTAPRPSQRSDAPPSLNEEALYRSLMGIFFAGGFSAVVLACQRQQKRIARENRAAVDRQGWIV